MAEDEARIKKEAEEKASREPKSIPVIGGHAETEETEKVGWKDGRGWSEMVKGIGKGG